MEYSYFGIKGKEPRQFSSSESSNIDESNGWRRLCATDCNGTLQNVNDPCKTHKCYLNKSSSHSNPGERCLQDKDKFKIVNIPQEPSPSVNLTSNKHVYHEIDANNLAILETINSKKLSTVIEKNVNRNDGMNKPANSELSFFSDKFSTGLSSNPKRNDDFEENKPKKFTLFPEKSSSSPSLLNGLNSYFGEKASLRPRCLSDPVSKPNTLFSDHSKEHSLNSHHSVEPQLLPPPNKEGVLSDVGGYIKNNIMGVKLLNNFSDELGLKLKQKRTPDSVSSPTTCDILPKTSFDLCSELSFYQDEQEIQSGSKFINFNSKRAAQDYLETDESYLASLVTKRMVQNQNVPFGNSSDIYSFHFKVQNSIFPFRHHPAFCYNIEAGRLSHDLGDLFKKFQSLALKKNEGKIFHKLDRSTSQECNRNKINQKNSPEAMECKFCKSNLETPETYQSHTLKQRIGKRLLVTCPVLRRLTCERCGATGDTAHTLSYCPIVINETGRKPVSVAAELKKTRRFASGKVRRSFY